MEDFTKEKMKKREVKFTKEEAEFVEGILKRGNTLATVRRRAQVLELNNKGQSDKLISEMLGISTRSVSEIRKKYSEKGLKECIYGEHRSGRPKRISMEDETELVALACSSPPEGRARWTLELLEERMNQKMKKSSIQILLKKTEINHGNKKCGVLEN